MTPQAVSDVTLAFPANIGELLPDLKTIPEEFFKDKNKWVTLVNVWFYEGLHKPRFVAKADIDPAMAYRHVSAIIGSFEIKHEHKTASVAYLLSEWFDTIEYYHKGVVQVVSHE